MITKLDSFVESIIKIEKYLSTHQLWLVAIVAVLFLISVLIGRKHNKTLFVLYILVILYLTLLNRNFGKRRISLNLFWSYQFLFSNDYFRREILNNILLFIPLGTVLSQIRPKWNTALMPVLVSFGVEILQFITARGLFELDDIISNSLGGLIGFAAGMLWIFCRNRIVIRS